MLAVPTPPALVMFVTVMPLGMLVATTTSEPAGSLSSVTVAMVAPVADEPAFSESEPPVICGLRLSVVPAKQSGDGVVIGPFPSGSRQKLYWPPVCTPTVNCRLIEAPAVSGVARPMAGTLKVELKPPPAACAGGVSTVVPEMFAVPPPLSETLVFDEVSARRSALFTAGGFVVMLTMRKRSCGRSAPVLFVKVRRKL